jgi:undecaprenyl-diphosphatase
MDLFQAIVFGAVQGITEFLPISSTAHLILVPWFMGWPAHSLEFDVALHLGTLVALLIYFRSDWVSLTRSSARLLQGDTSDPHARLAAFIIVATIPGALAGLFAEDFIESTLRSDPRVISFTLITLALVLVAAELTGKRNKGIDKVTWTDAITVGLAQAVALIPGVSRSGVTITAGLFRGLHRDTAARFSFLLSAPIIAGAVGKKLFDIAQTGLPADQMLSFAAGILASGIVGYASIAVLLRYLQSNNTFIFIYYRIALGIVVYLAFWSGFR